MVQAAYSQQSAEPGTGPTLEHSIGAMRFGTRLDNKPKPVLRVLPGVSRPHVSRHSICKLNCFRHWIIEHYIKISKIYCTFLPSTLYRSAANSFAELQIEQTLQPSTHNVFYNSQTDNFLRIVFRTDTWEAHSHRHVQHLHVFTQCSHVGRFLAFLLRACRKLHSCLFPLPIDHANGCRGQRNHSSNISRNQKRGKIARSVIDDVMVNG